ncbi:acetyl-CoA carboxylase biotin carboxylase subunit [Marininema halotolerans]|uniref:biotin carboxylase n=1 Tax=Marininema halotolerans TaxID=1155944 RepID=A0A1I6QBT9_9BACL|nr:acetyl-CoA carboxylase biotin carboxylase subunit [Marininema halotolerans]SFS49760.1 acetyl-CoA carboxylase, biotin carboxylase subunit [Marininema halotolerans]
MQKLLIANRGEIARRIMKTCRENGILTVAVYSDADKDLPFVQEADESVRIGPPPVAQSYLNAEAIVDAARQTGADAIHPGYGLLSENADFARRVQDAGITFVGPDADVIAAMGDKVTARRRMAEAGVPIVPGTDGVKDVEQAVREAEAFGYPVMLKASAGGGGIGMQVLDSEEALIQAFPALQGRAKAYFGDGSLFLEKFIAHPRHVEVQVMADQYGNVIHLLERECSVQRRNQKVIEECPSPSIQQETREALWQAAVKAAQAVGYSGAGTVEFLVDAKEEVYFLEMNTRLQVEHPVTEMVTGLDLVHMQLKVAQGEKLTIEQDDVRIQGHAIEYRVYAEDPDRFLPSPGKLNRFVPPVMEGVRVDAGVTEGSQITPFYDPMIAKCIIHGDDRQTALKRSKEALATFEIEGIKHNLPLFTRVLDHPDFVAGHYDTALLTKMNNHAGKGLEK